MYRESLYLIVFVRVVSLFSILRCTLLFLTAAEGIVKADVIRELLSAVHHELIL
jgi:hypothetical protein